MSTAAENPNLMEALVSLAKRRGFIYPSSEIYGGLNGFFDYGPLGAELKRNIRDCWWRDMVHRRDDIVGLESSIIMHPKVWEASGHVAGFTDPLVDCKVSKQRYRADQLFFAAVVVDGKTIGYVSALESERTGAELQEAAETFKRKKAVQGTLAPVQVREFTEATPDEIPLIPSPATGEPASLAKAPCVPPCTPPWLRYRKLLASRLPTTRSASPSASRSPKAAARDSLPSVPGCWPATLTKPAAPPFRCQRHR